MYPKGRSLSLPFHCSFCSIVRKLSERGPAKEDHDLCFFSKYLKCNWPSFLAPAGKMMASRMAAGACSYRPAWPGGSSSQAGVAAAALRSATHHLKITGGYASASQVGTLSPARYIHRQPQQTRALVPRRMPSIQPSPCQPHAGQGTRKSNIPALKLLGSLPEVQRAAYSWLVLKPIPGPSKAGGEKSMS